MMQKLGHIAPAFTRAVLDLLANLVERPAFPRHRERGQVPFGMAWDVRRIEIRWPVTSVARKRRRAVPVGPAHHHRLMQPHPIGLMGAIASRMTVDAAWMQQHLAGFL